MSKQAQMPQRMPQRQKTPQGNNGNHTFSRALNQRFTRISNAIAYGAGHAATFIIACLVVLIWAVTGPFFKFSDSWQLVINTGTTIITFLMVFLIQNTQNRDGAAIQAKLDELIRVSSASNAFIGIEHLTQEEVDAFREKCAEAAAKSSRRAVRKAQEKAHKAAEDAV